MTNVKVFWFGTAHLRSARAGIKPNGYAVYDERIAKELVRVYGDRIMTADQNDRIIHIGSKVNPMTVVKYWPNFRKYLSTTAVPTPPPKLPEPAVEVVIPVAPQIKKDDEQRLKEFLEANEPVIAEQILAPSGLAQKEDDTLEKPKRGRRKKSEQDEPPATIE